SISRRIRPTGDRGAVDAVISAINHKVDNTTRDAKGGRAATGIGIAASAGAAEYSWVPWTTAIATRVTERAPVRDVSGTALAEGKPPANWNHCLHEKMLPRGFSPLWMTCFSWPRSRRSAAS